MKKNILVIAIVGVIVIGVIAFSLMQAAPQNEKPKVRIAYLPVVQGLPLYIALEKGYFDEAGIEVEATKIDSPNLIIDALISDQVDFGVATASGITAVSENVKPGKLKIFAIIGGNNSTTNDLLIVRQDSEMKSISDLREKRLGILPGIQFRTIAQDILAKNGLEIDTDVTIVELAPALQVQALASGQVDAVLTIEPTGTISEVREVGRELIHAPMVRFISDPWYGAVQVIRTDYAIENPETTQIVLDVFERAFDEINQNPEQSKQFLVGYTALDEEIVSAVPLPIFKIYRDFDQTDIDSLQAFFDIFTAYNVIDSRVDAQSLVYRP